MAMLSDSIQFVINGAGFWTAIGWVIACGIIIGAIVHNGDLKSLSKGIIVFGTYFFFVSYTTLQRLTGLRDVPLFDRHPNSTASLITNVFVAIAYLIGMFLGVITVYCVKNKVWTKFKKKLHKCFV